VTGPCETRDMATRERSRDRGAIQASWLLRTVGAELRTARTGAGLSIKTAASAVDLDPTTFGRIEKGALRTVSVKSLSIACAAVGLKLVARAYPDGDPVRDAGHRRLLDRLRARLPHDAPWRTEVPIPIPGDRRAIDGWTVLGGRTIGFEAETRLDDVQALDRRAQLKKRDAGLDVLVLVVSDTPHNRRVLEGHREALRANFPLDTRVTLRALASTVAPAGNAIVVL